MLIGVLHEWGNIERVGAVAADYRQTGRDPKRLNKWRRRVDWRAAARQQSSNCAPPLRKVVVITGRH